MRGVYDDNINLERGKSTGDFYFTIEPGITVGFGDIVTRDENYLRLEYTPSIFLFAQNSNNDAVQHVVHAEAQYRLSKLTLGLSQDVQLLNGTDLNQSTGTGSSINQVNLDVSGRTRVNIFVTRLTASYNVSEKTGVSAALENSRSDYNRLISSDTVSGNIFVNYTYSPKIVVGVGASGGYLFSESGNTDQNYEQANVRVSYQLTGKLSTNGSAGLELRQFQGANASGTNFSPVFELAVIYQPFDATTLTLSATRRILSSAVLDGQDYTTTGVTISGRQRFYQRFFVGLTLGYEHSSYFNTIKGSGASREDDYVFVQPTFDLDITRYWSAGLFYLHRENSTSQSSFSFRDNQFGLRTTFTF